MLFLRHTLLPLFLLSLLSGGCLRESTLPGYYRESYRTLEGGSLRLADLPQKVLLLFFWTSDCGSCSAITPLVQELARSPGLQESLVLGVNTDTAVEPSLQKSRARLYGLKGDSLLDPDFQLVQALQVETAPALAVLYDTGHSIEVFKFYEFDGVTAADLLRTIQKRVKP